MSEQILTSLALNFVAKKTWKTLWITVKKKWVLAKTLQKTDSAEKRSLKFCTIFTLFFMSFWSLGLKFCQIDDK